MTDPVEQPTAPFNHMKADIILRSSDNVNFRVFRLFLSLASPFFETLFEIPQPADASADQEMRDGLVVVPVAESSKTLDVLLRFCYLCTLADDPKLEDFKEALNVLEAARKYSLDAIEKKVRRAIVSPKILDAQPLKCFVIARQGRLREETLLSAKYALTLPLVPEWFQEIDRISAADLLSLLTYHKRCDDAIYALRTDQSWTSAYYKNYHSCHLLFGQVGNYNNCRCPRSSTLPHLFSNQLLQWWDDFLQDVFTVLRDRPCKATVQASVEKTIEAVKARNCPACSPRITEGMRNISDLLVSKVDEIVAQIELQLDF